jgi:Transposase, Mutator family
MAAELDEVVESFLSQRLDGGPYTFIWIDALTQKVREGGRTVNVHRLIATGVNADGHREILGVDGRPSSGSSARSWPSRTANGPNSAATWDHSPPAGKRQTERKRMLLVRLNLQLRQFLLK